jgi:hypothetical protein
MGTAGAVVIAVSSTTKLVWSATSSCIRNCTLIVWPT